MDYFKKDWKKLQETDLNVRRILFNYPLERVELVANATQTAFASRRFPYWADRIENGRGGLNDMANVPPPLPRPATVVLTYPLREYNINQAQFGNNIDMVYSEKSPWAMKSHINLPLYTNPTNIPFSKMTYRAYKNPKKWESSVKWKSAPKLINK